MLDLFVGGAILLALAAASPGSQPAPGGSTGAAAARRADLKARLERSGLPQDWRDAFLAIAYRESSWHPRAALGRPWAGAPDWIRWSKAGARTRDAERAGARRIYERNADRFADCGHPASEYQFGSGGLFGFLPSTGLHAFSGTALFCLSPLAVFDPDAAIAMAVGYATRLQNWQGYRSGPHTWQNLNRGWKSPGNMGSPQPRSDAAFTRGLRAAGVPASIANRKPSKLGPELTAFAVYHRLKGASA